jgi:hypothetical protein
MMQTFDEDRIVDVLLLGGYLTIIILRIIGTINWGWEWILLPLWLPLVGVIVGLVLSVIIGIPWKIYLMYKEKNK